MTTTLDEIFELSDLTDKTIYDPQLTYLFNRYVHDMEQYKTFVSECDLHVARWALDDAVNDLLRLLRAIDPKFTRGDAELLNFGYIREHMNGFVY